jgi:hypothetical protein
MISWFRKRKTSPVAEIMTMAEVAAAAAKHGNHIKVRMVGSSVLLITLVNGMDMSWISFDGPQLDELISLLEEYRQRIK